MHNPYESSSLGYINTNRKSNYGMDAFYLSYFGKDATWNGNRRNATNSEMDPNI